MDGLKLTGVVVRVVDYGESDRVLSLLTRERGKVSLFARRARVSRRRFGGALEPFTLLAAEARERRGGGLLDLESVSVVRGFARIREDLASIGCAGYACELARELVQDAEPHPELLEVLVAYLSLLDGAPARPAALRAFELAALQSTGLMPRLTGCARCGSPPPLVCGDGAGAVEARVAFDPAEGGVVCAPCARRLSQSARSLLPASIAAMARLQAPAGAAVDERFLREGSADPLAAEVGTELREALSSFIEHHLGRRLASRKFLDEVGPVL